MIEVIELMSDTDESDDDDDIDVCDGKKTSSDLLVMSCKPQDHIQMHEKNIQEPSEALVTKARTPTTIATTTLTNKIMTMPDQRTLDLNITDMKVPNTIQSSFALDDSTRLEPNDTKKDTKCSNNEAMDEKQGALQEQNQKDNDDNQRTNSRPPCRKRCSPQEAVELSDLRIRLELKSGYKPSSEEVEEQYYQKQLKKKTEEKKKRKTLSNKKKGNSARKKKCKIIDNRNHYQNNSHNNKTSDECRSNNDIISSNIISSSSTTTRKDNNSSPVKRVLPLTKKRISQWEKMYKTLVEYINIQNRRSSDQMEISKEEGSCTIIPSIWDGNVPQDFITNDGIRLGRWIGHQRSNKQNGILNPEHEQRLSSIGFKWRKHQLIPWDDMFESLKEYITYQRNTIDKDWSGRVPGDYHTDDNPPRLLGSWVRMQHYALTKNKLCNEYVEKLNSLSFQWIISTSKIWNSNAKRTSTTKASNNNKKHDKNDNFHILHDENTTSSTQQQQQQQQQHGRNDIESNSKTSKTKTTKPNGNNDQMEATCKNSKTSSTNEKHENINKSQGAKCCVASNSQNSVWENMYKSLVEYINQRRSKEGITTIPWIWDGNVPQNFITNDGIRLGWWIGRQRTAKKIRALNPEREKRLTSIGLKWRSSKRNSLAKQQQQKKHGRNDNKLNPKPTKANDNNQMEASDNTTSSSKTDENVSKSKEKFEKEICIIYQESISSENSRDVHTIKDHYDIKDNDSSSRQVDSIIKNNETITLQQQQEEELLKSRKLKLQKYPMSFFDEA